MRSYRESETLDDSQSGGSEQKCFQVFPEDRVRITDGMFDGKLFQITGAE